MMPETSTLSGYLMATSTGARVSPAGLTHVGGLRQFRQLYNTKWEEYIMDSAVPLMMEDRSGAKGPFEYRIRCRRSGPRVLVMGDTTRVADVALGRIRAKETEDTVLVHLNVRVDSLVKDITKTPGAYTISFVHARLQGSVLKATSFYGEDITEASFFRDNLKLLTCYTCGLRDVQTGIEILRVGGDGHIFFFAPRNEGQLTTRLGEVEAVLGFLNAGGYLSSPES